MPALPVYLTENALPILRRGGSDATSDDQMVLLEILKRAPGMDAEGLKTCFIGLRMEYGDDALRAVRSGHVQFEAREAQ